MRIALLNWRDSTHPEGGGAERYAENVGAGLVSRGHHVSMFCASHARAPAREWVEGVSVRRQGGRLSVYPSSLRALRTEERRGGRYDVVVDVQNGVPFFSPLGTRSPVVNLVHHVHREQWPVVFGPMTARLGWTVESRVAPRVYRGRQYVAVSALTRAELVDLGVEASRISVIHNGTADPLVLPVERTAQPTIVVLGRLVPHKRVEHAIDVVAALRTRFPGLRLRVVGDGWWRERVEAHAVERGVSDVVDVLGFVPEELKHAELAAAWVALAPSVKEGWGLCVVEAASHGVPTVAYRGAGGLSESILDGSTGLLAAGFTDLVGKVARLLEDESARLVMGEEARVHAKRFSWETAVDAWERLLRHTAQGAAPVSLTDAVVEAR